MTSFSKAAVVYERTPVVIFHFVRAESVMIRTTDVDINTTQQFLYDIASAHGRHRAAQNFGRTARGSSCSHLAVRNEFRVAVPDWRPALDSPGIAVQQQVVVVLRINCQLPMQNLPLL